MRREDAFQRFLFEDLGIRGELVHLEQSWHAVLHHHDYPEAVRAQLGQAMAAVLLLAATIKFKGSLILQAQGAGPLSTLVAQATDEKTVRGVARWRGDVPAGPLAAVFGTGNLVLTIQNETSEPYQGVVPLEGLNLAAALESYFSRSEQLATRIWLAANGHAAAGLFLQQIPTHPCEIHDWDRVALLAGTVTSAELLQLAGDQLLYRLFHEERVRLFAPEPVSFRCTCTRERIGSMLLALGRAEIDEILSEQGKIDVHCEFCNRLYRFDAVDAAGIFSNQPRPPASRRHH